MGAPQTLTIGGTGTIVVEVTQAASKDGDFKAAGTITASIAVKAAPQTITFTTPAGTLATDPAGIPYGSSLTLAATGGASGQPVVFTLDPSSTAGAATLTTKGVLTANTLGTIVIDANQAADTNTPPNYLVAPTAYAYFVVTPLGIAATPVISPYKRKHPVFERRSQHHHHH